MCAIVRSKGKSLAVSHFSAENQLYEAQRKIRNHGRSRQEIRCPYRSGDGQILPRRTRETVSRRSKDHRFREAENARQAFKISSNLFGSSPYPSSRIDRTKSSSRGVANIPRSTSISSSFAFLPWRRAGVGRDFSPRPLPLGYHRLLCRLPCSKLATIAASYLQCSYLRCPTSLGD
jgi:hypothetical protein